jgi:hypothetical protein
MVLYFLIFLKIQIIIKRNWKFKRSVKGVGFVEVASRHATTEERRWRHDARSPRPTLLVLAINSRHVFTRLLNFWYYSVALESALPTILLAYQMVDSNSLFFWFCALLDYIASLCLCLSVSLTQKTKETKKKFHWKFCSPFLLDSRLFGLRFLFLAGLLAKVDWLHSRLNLLARDFVVGTSICVKQVRLLPFFLFLIRRQLPSFSYTRWSDLTASQCLLCDHFFFLSASWTVIVISILLRTSRNSRA